MITTILPTDTCNLDCVYCVSRKGHNRMDMRTLYNTIDFVAAVHDHTKQCGHIEWHAAEPMTMPLSFFEDAERRFKAIGCDVERVMCSNLALLTDEWVDFIQKYKYGVSTSLDGDVYLHDANRGQGSFEKAIRAISKLEKNGIYAGHIAVLSPLSCKHADEIYPFFKYAKRSFKLNIATPNTFQKETLAAMILIFEEWFADKNSIRIDPFDEMVNFFLKKEYARKCYCFCNESVICIDSFGDVYPCESFVINRNTGDYVLGNVNTDQWEDIWFGEKRAKFLKFQNNIKDECKECPYVQYCGGGCSADSVMIGNTETKMGSTCEIIKPLMDHISAKIGWLGEV